MSSTQQQPPQTAELSPEDQVSKELEILARQQEAESEDEQYLSDGADVVDANDVSATNRDALNLNLSNIDQKIWLVRLPRFLSTQLRDKSNFHEQTLGSIKIEKVKDASKTPIMKMRLNESDQHYFKDIPHDYDLHLTKKTVENQYVFTEENLTSFNGDATEKTELDFKASKAKSIEENKEPLKDKNPNDNPAPNQQNSDSTSTSFTLHANQPFNGIRKKRRFNKFRNRDGTQKVIPFVKTIPKKTAILGTVAHECLAVPSADDPNYSKIIEARKKMIREEPRPTVTLLNENSGVTFSNTGLTLKTDNSSFLKTSTVKNKSEGRAIRMPQKDLFDLLFKLFDEYDYWSLKGIKERTKQPDVYLKETLEQIAILIKKGPYALKYALKKEYKELKDQERAAKLGELGLQEENNDDEDDEEENEDDLEMVDVV